MPQISPLSWVFLPILFFSSFFSFMVFNWWVTSFFFGDLSVLSNSKVNKVGFVWCW